MTQFAPSSPLTDYSPLREPSFERSHVTTTGISCLFETYTTPNELGAYRDCFGGKFCCHCKPHDFGLPHWHACPYSCIRLFVRLGFSFARVPHGSTDQRGWRPCRISMLRAASPNIFPIVWWSLALSVGVSIAAMALLRVTHPPAGGNPIAILLAYEGWDYLIFPVLLGSVFVAMCGVAFRIVMMQKRSTSTMRAID
ncbi:hypothetical protein M2368_003546 [Arthrobacter sp. JUb119]|nr:hypothetical protein [Arthrobacter sp. JUb119]TDU22604.1 HPP family protein [Arthrobacter sp. JUb115]